MQINTVRRKQQYHVHLGIICYFLCAGGKVESVSRLFNMAQGWTQSTYDGRACIPPKWVLQYASKLWVSVRYMATSFANTACKWFKKQPRDY